MIRTVFILTIAFISLSVSGQSAVDLIEKNDRLSISDYLKNHDINQCHEVENSSYTLLTLSLKMDKVDLFNHLVENGADLNTICADMTPLMYAIKYNKEAAFQTLLAEGGDPNIKSRKGKTVTEYAKQYKRMNMLATLQATPKY